jgi:hypothetical protein
MALDVELLHPLQGVDTITSQQPIIGGWVVGPVTIQSDPA